MTTTQLVLNFQGHTRARSVPFIAALTGFHSGSGGGGGLLIASHVHTTHAETKRRAKLDLGPDEGKHLRLDWPVAASRKFNMLSRSKTGSKRNDVRNCSNDSYCLRNIRPDPTISATWVGRLTLY